MDVSILHELLTAPDKPSQPSSWVGSISRLNVQKLNGAFTRTNKGELRVIWTRSAFPGGSDIPTTLGMTATHFHSSTWGNTICSIQGSPITEGYVNLLGITRFPFAKLDVIVDKIRFICAKHPKLSDVSTVTKMLWVLLFEDSYRSWVIQLCTYAKHITLSHSNLPGNW